MRRKPTLGGLCIALAAVGVGLYLQQTTFAGNFCSNYRKGCVARGGDGYSVLLAILVPALFLAGAGVKLIWDAFADVTQQRIPISGLYRAIPQPDTDPSNSVPTAAAVTCPEARGAGSCP